MKRNSFKKPGVIVIFAVLSVSVITYSGCTKKYDSNNNPPVVPANEVYIQGNSFTPSTLTISVNTTVTWTNKDGIAHTVTSDAPMFDSGSMGDNATFSFQFTSTGTFNYHCTIHPSMTARVIVQ